MKRIELIVWLFVAILLLVNCEESNTGPVDEDFLIEVSQTSVLIFEGETKQLSATLYDADSLIIEEVVDWQSSAADVASVSDAGLVIGLTDGYAEIIVSYNDQSDTISVYVVKSLSFTKYSGNPVMEIGSPGAWDGNYFWKFCVRSIDGEYCMWYSATAVGFSNGPIGYASSSDGITWTKYAANPLQVTGERNSYVEGPSIIFTGSEYKMWYRILEDDATKTGIHYSSSTDGITWTKLQADPFFLASQEWENSDLGNCCVVTTDNGYLMVYDGDGSEKPELGLASSEDGIHWTKYSGNPVLSAIEGEWTSFGLWNGDIIIKDDVIHIFFTAGSSDDLIAKIGHAISLDGINWLQDPGNPVLSPGPGSYDAGHVFNPSVVFEEDGTVKMWYGGAPSTSSVATKSYNLAISE